MIVPSDLIHSVDKKVDECLRRISDVYGVEMDRPEINFNQTGMTAGVAELRSWRIRLNPVLLIENKQDFINRTVPHEVAHLAVQRIYPEAHTRSTGKRELHGPCWREIMDALGADPARCHQYDITNVKRNVTKYDYECVKCGHVYSVGGKMHNRIQAGVPYSCALCGKGARIRAIVSAPVPVIKPAHSSSASTASAGGTKIQRCFELYKQHGSTHTRAAMINMFVESCGCTSAGASTYYATCKKMYLEGK